MSIGSMEAHPDIPRVDPDLMSDELTTDTHFLDYHRATLQLKCAGLDDEQLKRRAIPGSSLSLLGLVRHLTEVERNWFARMLDGQANTPIYYSDADPDGDFDTLDSVPVTEVWSNYHAAVVESRRVLASFTGPGDVSRGTTGRPRTVRWVLVHLIEEYARHNGHADLLREVVDGVTGE